MAEKIKVGDKVWMACRGHHRCDGQQAEIVQVFQRPGTVTRTIRYKCLKCNRLFGITL